MISPAATDAARKRGGGRCERAEADEVVQARRTDHVLADVDRPRGAGDVGDGDVQALAARQRRVDEPAGQVETYGLDIGVVFVTRLRCETTV
jgi:hypothetical protein